MFEELKRYSPEEIISHLHKKVRCIIHSTEKGMVIIDDAILNYNEDLRMYYLCQNIIKGGITHDDRKGYRYSWKIRIDHPESCKIHELQLIR